MVPDISTLVQKSNYDTKLQKLKTNMLVIPDLTQKKKKKLQTFDSSFFRGKSHFEEGSIQNYYFNQYADILK